MKRRRAREYALMMLFQSEYVEGAPDISEFWKARGEGAEPEVREFAESIVRGALRYRAEIDSELQGCMDNWTLDRLAAVDRAGMRAAAYEILYRPEIPHAVTINEALEIAKKYSTEESAAFINGILDKLARKKRPSR